MLLAEFSPYNCWYIHWSRHLVFVPSLHRDSLPIVPDSHGTLLTIHSAYNDQTHTQQQTHNWSVWFSHSFLCLFCMPRPLPQCRATHGIIVNIIISDLLTAVRNTRMNRLLVSSCTHCWKMTEYQLAQLHVDMNWLTGMLFRMSRRAFYNWLLQRRSEKLILLYYTVQRCS